MKTKQERFVSNKDLIITPLVELVLIALSSLLTFGVHHLIVSLRWLEAIVVLYVFLIVLTLIALKLIRTLFPFKEGVFTAPNQSNEIYIWNLYGFLCVMNLSLFYTSSLLPIPIRKLFLQLLGAQIGKGVFAIGGHVTDPHMVEIGDNAILGDECYISPHAIVTLSGGDALVVRKIVLKKNCIIGARAIIQPGVVVGENANVAVNALVPMNTVIPDRKSWPSK